MSTSPRPSRRTVVRTAVWTTPAITMAVTAPAFAESTYPGLAIDPGGTSVGSRRMGGARHSVLLVDGASVTATDGIGPGTSYPGPLRVRVGFGSPDEAENLVLMLGDPAPGWATTAVRSDPANGVIEPYDGIVFEYQGEVAAGVPVAVTVPEIAAAMPTASGVFGLEFTADGFEQAGAGFRAPVTFIFDPGATRASPQPGEPDYWGLELSGSSVAPPWSAYDPWGAIDLTMTVTFVAELGSSGLQALGEPTGWSLISNDGTSLVYRWTGCTTCGRIPLPDGTFFTAAAPEDQQQGWFRLTFDVPDASVSHDFRSPLQELVFSPGPSGLASTVAGGERWYFADFDGASVVASGDDLAAGDLEMTVHVEPLGDATSAALVRTGSELQGWTTSDPVGEELSQLSYRYSAAVSAGEPVSLDLAPSAPDAGPFGTATPGPVGAVPSNWTGAARIYVTFSAPGFVPALYDLDLPPELLLTGETTLQQPPGAGGGVYAVDFRDAEFSLGFEEGMPVGPGELTLTISYYRDGQTQEPGPVELLSTPDGWSVATVSSSSVAFTRDAGAPPGKVPFPDGLYVATAEPWAGPGAMVVVVLSAPGYRSSQTTLMR